MFGTIVLILVIGGVLFAGYIFVRSRNLPKDTSRKPQDAYTALGINPLVGTKKQPERVSLQPTHLEWYTGKRAITPAEHKSIIKAPGPWASANIPGNILGGIDINGNLIPGQGNPFQSPVIGEVFDSDDLRGIIFENVNTGARSKRDKLYDDSVANRKKLNTLMTTFRRDFTNPHAYDRRQELRKQMRETNEEWKQLMDMNERNSVFKTNFGKVQRLSSNERRRRQAKKLRKTNGYVT